MDLERIVEACKSGNRNAFGLVYKRYYKKLLAISLYYVSDENIAKDILHDGFIIIMSSIQSLHSADKLESWMCIIIKNLSIRYLKENNSSLVFISDMNESELTNEEDTDSSELNVPSYEELMLLVDELPNGYQKIFRLSVLEGLSHKEIADLLNIAPHSSSSQQHRAKEQMKKLLAEHHYVWFICLLIIIPLGIIIQKMMVGSTTENKHETIVQKVNHAKPSSDTLDESRPTSDKDSIIIRQLKKHSSPIMESVIAAIDTDTLKVDVLAETTNKKNDTTVVKKQHKQYDGSSFDSKKLVATATNQWNIKLVYSGIDNTQNGYNTLFNPGGIGSSDPEQAVVKEQHKHYAPFIIGVSFGKNLSNRFGLTAGLRYSYLKSNFEQTSKYKTETTLQKIHYVGIPLGLKYSIYTTNHFVLYTNAGVALDIPVSNRSISTIIDANGRQNTSNNVLDPSLQWSIFSGIGLQYNLTPHIGLYMEPQLNYYFNNGDHISNTFKDKPLNVEFPLGIRITW